MSLFLLVTAVSIIISLLANYSNPFLRMSILSEGARRWLFLLVNEIAAFYAAYLFTDDSNRKTFI